MKTKAFTVLATGLLGALLLLTSCGGGSNPSLPAIEGVTEPTVSDSTGTKVDSTGAPRDTSGAVPRR